MVTKTIVLTQLPEFQSGGKLVRGVLSLSGDNQIKGSLRVNNIPEFVKKLKLIVKVGNKNFTFNDVAPQNYDFLLETALTDDISVLLVNSTSDGLVGVAGGGKAI